MFDHSFLLTSALAALVPASALLPARWRFGATVAASAIFIASSSLMAYYLQGTARLATLDALNFGQDGTVLGSYLDGQEWIYVLILFDNQDTPTHYRIPWSEDLEDQLRQAEEDSRQNDTPSRFSMPYEPSLDDRDPKFYNLPPARSPSKPESGSRSDQPFEYERPGVEA